MENNPFSLDQFPFMVDVWQDESPNICIQKCTQVSASVSGLLIAVHRAYFKKRNQIYFFPTEDAVSEFVKSKFDPLITENPSVKSMISNSDSMHLKQVGSAFLFFRGMKSKSKMISISAQDITFDELNFFDDIKSVELAEKRASAAINPRFIYQSHPTVPNYGVSAKYDNSDQKERLIKCSACNHWNEPSSLIPKKLEQWQEYFEPGFLQCLKCGNQLDPYQSAWVAKYPDRSKTLSGYWIPRFISPRANFIRLMEGFHSATDIQNYYNTELGLPYADADSRINYAEVMNLCANYTMPETASKTTLGVDVGEHQLWAVISRPSQEPGKLRDYLFIGEVKGEGMQKWANLEALCNRLGVREGMIDSEPDPSASREFVKKMGCRSPSQDGRQGNTFWLNRYVESKTEAGWNADKQEMQINRTESMDSSHRLLRMKLIQLPHRNHPAINVFAKHCEGTAKQGELNPKTFNMEYTWVKLGPDHLRHAFNYDAMLWYNGEKAPRPNSVVKLGADAFYHPKTVGRTNTIKLGW